MKNTQAQKKWLVDFLENSNLPAALADAIKSAHSTNTTLSDISEWFDRLKKEAHYPDGDRRKEK